MCGGTPNYKLLENNLLRRGRGVVVATCSSRNFNFFPITQARALKKLRARVALHTSEKSKLCARASLNRQRKKLEFRCIAIGISSVYVYIYVYRHRASAAYTHFTYTRMYINRNHQSENPIKYARLALSIFLRNGGENQN